MKTLIGIIAIACLTNISSNAQTLNPVKVHFLNTVIANNAEIKVESDQKGPVLIKSRTWTTIQTTSDSLGLIVDGKTYFIHFEPHKQYYFVIQGSYSSRPVVTEKSEREFVLTATINAVKGPEIYVLGNTAN